MSTTTILHFGLQRSGTNFFEHLVKENFNVRFLNNDKERGSPYHKHFRLYDNKRIIPEVQFSNAVNVCRFRDYERLFHRSPDYYFIISKDPYSWLLSYRSWGKKCDWPKPRHHYIEEYNYFYGKFLELSSETKKIFFVRYVDLLEDANQVLKRQPFVSFAKKSFLFSRNSSHKNSIFKVPHSCHFSDERRVYYLEERYLQEYDPAELNEVNKALDGDVLARLGYMKAG